MTQPMIADVLATTIFRHADQLPNTLKNCDFAPGNLTGETVCFRALKTNKKLSWARVYTRKRVTRAQLRFRGYPSAKKSLRIPDKLIAGIQIHNVVDNR